MAEYCTVTDLTNRLTDAGIKWVADRDRNGTVSDAETTAYLTSCIQRGGNMVDGYICRQVNPTSARGTSNTWLRDRCVDIATYYACGIGGRSVKDSIAKVKDEAIAELQRIEDGGKIPNYPYPAPINAITTSYTPKLARISGRSQPRQRFRGGVR